MHDRRHVTAPSMHDHVLGRSKESSKAKGAHWQGDPAPVDSHPRRNTMTQLVLDILMQSMVGAAKEPGGRQWGSLRRWGSIVPTPDSFRGVA